MPTRFLNLPTFISLPRNCAFQTYQGTGESSYTLRVTVNNSAMEEGTLFLTNFWLFQDTLGIIIMYYILLNKKWLYSPISNALVGPCMSSVLSRVWLLATPCCAPGSSIHGILQARILEWVAIFYSKGSSRPRDLICAPPGLLHWQEDSLPPHHLGRALASQNVDSPNWSRDNRHIFPTYMLWQDSKKDYEASNFAMVWCMPVEKYKRMKHVLSLGKSIEDI